MEGFERVGRKEKYTSNERNHIRPEAYPEISGALLENPKVLELGERGKMVYGSETGPNKKENEDAIIVHEKKNGFGVVDGMGGEAGGRIAARILAEEIGRAFEEGLSLSEAQKLAHQRMKEMQIIEGGACYLAARINDEDILEGALAGDVRLIVVRDGEVCFSSKDESSSLGPNFEHHVVNAVQGITPGTTKSLHFQLEKGDRILVLSDGATDNILDALQSDEKVNDEIARLTNNKSLPDAIATLREQAKKRMILGEHSPREGKPDDISIFGWEYKPTTKNEQSPKKDSKDKLKKKPERYVKDAWEYWNSVSDNEGQQAKIAQYMLSGDLDVLRIPVEKVPQSRAAIDQFLNKVAQGKISHLDKAKFLEHILGPIDDEKDPTKPMRIYKALIENDSEYPNSRTLVASWLGKSEGVVSVSELGQFFHKFPNPAGLEHVIQKHARKEMKEMNRDQQVAYLELIRNTLHKLYGKQQEYFEQWARIERKRLL